MKRFVLILLLLCILLTACMHKNEIGSEDQEKVLDQTQNELAVQPQDKAQKPTLKMIQSRIDIKQIENNTLKPFIPTYEAKVAPYTIAKDLSNVVNIGQFSGFTPEQIRMLVENGFVVVPSTDTKMHYVYDLNEYYRVPNFITVDSVLHTFHQFYSKSLMHIESNYLFEDLNRLTANMLEASIRVYDVLHDEQLKKLQEKNIVYLFVARKLINPDLPLDARIQPEWLALAKQELALIAEADGYALSPLLRFDLDYSQFTIRGHYTRNEELGRYFQTMMWLGTVPYAFYDEEDNFLYENVLQALLLAYTTFIENGEESSADLWAKIYIPTGQYVGLSDDVHVYQMHDVILSVYGEVEDPNIFNAQPYHDALVQAIMALPEPKIQGKYTNVTTPVQKQFRFMGQRFILDGYILQELMQPIVRPVPSGLDVMGVLGSKIAEHLLLNVLRPQDHWPEYIERYYELKDLVASTDQKEWRTNLFNGWLWAIQEVLREFAPESGMPWFMTTEAWKYKSLNAALGSYTELKHDTVLYGKQPVAEAGGMIDWENLHYVEPNVPLYSKLLYLTEYTVSVLKEHGMLNEDLEQGAESFQMLLNLLIECSIKELHNEPLSEEENLYLLGYGGWIEFIARNFLNVMTDDFSTIEVAELLVSDIATIAPNEYSSGGYVLLGTGYFDHIYVIVPMNGKLYLTRGSVYSYYEFLSDQRLTNEQWWEWNGIFKAESEYGSYVEKVDPSPLRPDQPFWIENFKVDHNEIEIQDLEVDWSRLND